jgi:hypothetical protein
MARRFWQSLFLVALVIAPTSGTWAQPTFVNGLVIPGGTLDATQQPGANAGRLGFFSDIYYDPIREQWWALSDRGPGGGVLDYGTRVQRFTIDVHPVTGRISKFRVKETITFTDPKGMLAAPTNPAIGSPKALNGLNPLVLNGDASVLGRSFDPEGLVVDPRTCRLLVSDEYGPSVYEFSRKGKLRRVFATPANLVPKVSGVVNYVADRDGGLNAGRQDNRGYEGLAITPDGKKLYAVLQDPLGNEPAPNNGRNGRNVRIVVYDNDRNSPTFGTSIAQYAYQLELQADVAARIVAAGGSATPTDPRQGRNIGLSAITAINDHEFLVLERDNRGIGVDDPGGNGVVGSKRIYTIDVTGATDISGLALPNDGNLAAAGITPVAKSAVFIDLAANTQLPNGKQAEKWEGMTIGPRLKNGAYLILTGNDNDYSVTQSGSGTQFDVYVDFNGGFVQRDIDQPTMLNGVFVGPIPAGHVLIPGVLHAYRASASDLAGYVKPGRDRHDRRHDRDDDDCDDDDGHGHGDDDDDDDDDGHGS